jgi:hypothetical protein
VGYGIAVEPLAPLQLVISLDSQDQIRLLSQEKGALLEERRPGTWALTDVCRDAAAKLIKALRPSVGAAPVPDIGPAPPRGGHPHAASLAGWFGPPPRVHLLFEGPLADAEHRSVCLKVLSGVGIVDESASDTQLAITISDDVSRIQVVSKSRGRLFDEPRPGTWATTDVCSDAVAGLVGALKSVPASEVAPVASSKPTLQLFRPDVQRGHKVDIFVTVGGQIIRVGNGKAVKRELSPGTIALSASAGARGNSTSALTLNAQPGARFFVRCQLVAAGGWTANCQLVPEVEGQVAAAQCESDNGDEAAAPAPEALIPPPVADAAAKPDAEHQRARTLYQEATAHYNLGENREALQKFKDAYRLVREPVLLFNIGQCHRRLGEAKEAIEMYRSFLREAPEAQNRKEVERLITDLGRTSQDRSATH